MKNTITNSINGPVFPILTIFNKDGSIDENGMVDYINYLLGKGVKNLMCTVGTSRYDVMTIDEMKLVNELLICTANKDVVTIVTTPPTGPVSQAIEFAEHAEKLGADAILGLYPDRYYGDESIISYFKDISDSTNLNLMIHEMPIRAGRSKEAPSWQYSLKVIEKILMIESIIGMKEESGDVELIKVINSSYANNNVIIGGKGGMSAHYQAREFGQRAYLVGIGNFIPDIELDFFQTMESGDNTDAQRFINKYEKPFFNFAIPIGWHPVLKEAMHIMGLVSPFERKPMLRIDKEERIQLEKVMKNLEFI